MEEKKNANYGNDEEIVLNTSGLGSEESSDDMESLYTEEMKDSVENEAGVESADNQKQEVRINYSVVESFGSKVDTSKTKTPKKSLFRANDMKYNDDTANGIDDDRKDADKIIEDNLQEFYQSAYYQNVQRKKSNRIRFIAIVAIAVLIYLGFVTIGGSLLAGKEKTASTESEKLEIEIEEKYGVIVNTGSEINALENDYLIYELDSSAQTYEALRAIDIVLDRLPQDFIDDISQKDDGRYLEINVTGEIVMPNNAGYAAGLTSFAKEKNVIRIDATSGLYMDLQSIIAHEIFHLIDYEMKKFDEYAASIEEWKMYNPTQFEYSVWESSNKNYIIEGSSISNTYFISAYSKQDVFEDRAEIFSYILSTDENGELPESYNSQYVKAKCRLLIKEIKQHFDSASGTLYIERWFE